jgi:molybdenum cofactor guanylyltransferase
MDPQLLQRSEGDSCMINDRDNKPYMPRIQGVVLAGGQSRRMGTSKALLPLPNTGQPLIRLIVDTLHQVCDGVTVVTSANASPEERQALQDAAGGRVLLAADRMANLGPLAGIHASLSTLPDDTDWAFIMACDMPIFSGTIFAEMAEHIAGPVEGLQAVCCRDQPFHAMYHRSAAVVAENTLLAGQLRLQTFLDHLNKTVILPTDQRCFTNLNTPDEFHSFFTK